MALGIEQGRESIMTELLLTMLENLIYDITGWFCHKEVERQVSMEAFPQGT